MTMWTIVQYIKSGCVDPDFSLIQLYSILVSSIHWDYPLIPGKDLGKNWFWEVQIFMVSAESESLVYINMGKFTMLVLLSIS